jgi:hypothetical protein
VEHARVFIGCSLGHREAIFNRDDKSRVRYSGRGFNYETGGPALNPSARVLEGHPKRGIPPTRQGQSRLENRYPMRAVPRRKSPQVGPNGEGKATQIVTETLVRLRFGIIRQQRLRRSAPGFADG